MSKGRLLKKLFAASLFGLLPTRLARPLLNTMGHRIRAGARVGFSWVWCDSVNLDRTARIGHLNVLWVTRILMRNGAYIGRMNVAKGPVNLQLRERAALGNQNLVLRGPAGVSQGPAVLRLGVLAKITAKHHVDCTRSVRMGDYSTLAGSSSQVWTHGYVHDMDGPGRYRIDGRIEIADNVYIGSACLVSMGVRIAKGVIVGGGTTVAHDLPEAGLYVSSAIRKLPRPQPPAGRPDLVLQQDPRLVDQVFVKQRP